MPFTKGNSGNPLGRPKGSLNHSTKEVRELLSSVLEISGECQSSVTSDTNFLIFGEQDYDKFGEGFKSSKIKKAEKLKLKGSDIELLSESQFLEHIK